MKLIADIEKLNQDRPAKLLVDSIEKMVDDETHVYYNFPLYRGICMKICAKLKL